MLRGAIALAWADHKLEENEKAQIMRFIERNIHLSDVQRRALEGDVQKPAALADIWPHISEKQDRAHLINIAPLIFQSDTIFCDAEQAVYDRMYADHMATIDTHGLEAEVQQMAKEMRQKITMRESIDAEVRAKNPIGRLLTYLEYIF